MKAKLLSEFLGTYVLIFIVTGSIMTAELQGHLDDYAIAVISGLTVMTIIYTIGYISGAHINPAVTIGFLVNGNISLKDAIGYIIIQIVAAVAASATLLMIFGNVSNLGASVTNVGIAETVVLEAILVFILMFVVLGVASHKKAISSLAGVAVGGVVALLVMFAGAVSGASLNPARSIGPSIMSGHFEHLWIYIVAPVIGAILAALVFKVLVKFEKEMDGI